MKVHVLVRPDPDEPFKVIPEQIDAGQAWLEERVESGLFEMCLPFEQTGGFVIVRVPEDVARVDVKYWVESIFGDYPLLGTIAMTIDIMFNTLQEGFDVLRKAHKDQRWIHEYTDRTH